MKHKEVIKRARGPAAEAAKRRALQVPPLQLVLLCGLTSVGPASATARSALAELDQRKWVQVLKQKRMLETQRDQLYNQQMNMEQTSFAVQNMQDNITQVRAMKAANKDLKGAFKSKELNIDNIEKMNDDMADMMVSLCEPWGCLETRWMPKAHVLLAELPWGSKRIEREVSVMGVDNGSCTLHFECEFSARGMAE